ncbi:ribophorin I [Gregarina niphandrodes]|uniref:Dolichyl-diphosphooligosaccharide--protein glycosyltransferase subunit 1 n=1 Tax=Gregarina niphandrodes TaxID=110365 RepID=A0A023BC63_GRENI|nr:ribophorin I [Gregarina niphandrodes]EZG82426.1 ribophorin I [Gregarina niphandrodes]|eukprot:XP_011128995.1 ribophorin I [Gregarina niphandrodes]
MKLGVWVLLALVGGVSVPVEQRVRDGSPDGIEQEWLVPEGQRQVRGIPRDVSALALIRSCDQKVQVSGPWLVDHTFNTNGDKFCVDIVAGDVGVNDTLIISYGGNYVRDKKLTKSWNDIPSNEFVCNICSDIVLFPLAGRNTTAAQVVNNKLKAIDPGFAVLSNGTVPNAADVLKTAERNKQVSFTSSAYIAAKREERQDSDEGTRLRPGLRPGLIDEETLRKMMDSCKDIQFSSRSFVPAKFTSVDTEYYLPFWTTKVRVTEDYAVRNMGAKVVGHYDVNTLVNLYHRTIGTYRASSSPSITMHGIIMSFLAEFPPSTSHHEFYDRIGNITTTEVLSNDRSGQLLALYPRHPILGQWNGAFTLRYHTPQQNIALYHSDGAVAIIPGRVSIGGYWIGTRNVRVILPPFSTITEMQFLKNPISQKVYRERQWLDVFPSRTVVELQFEDIPNYRVMKDGIALIR